MNRVRVSTTVDAERLDQARSLLGLRDSVLFDAALASLVRQTKIAAEVEAIERWPYDADPELEMPEPPVDIERGFDDHVPERVLALARRRRVADSRRSAS